MTATRKPRTKKTETTAVSSTAPTPAKTGRGRRKATGTQEQAAEHTAKELELIAKYPHQVGIVPQSYRVAGAEDRPGWGHKHTVLIRCCFPGGCEGSEPFVRATSDLQFTTTCYCSAHSKIIKANRRRTAAEKKSQ